VAFRDRCSDLLLDVTGRVEDVVPVRRALISRGKALGVDLDDPALRVAVGTTPSGDPVDADVVETWTADLVGAARGALLGTAGEGVLIILPGSHDGQSLAAEAAGRGLCIGVGGASGGLAGLGRSRAEAGLAAQQARREGRDLVGHDGLGLIDWMMLQTPAGVLLERAQRLIQPLGEHPELMETLRIYIEQRLNASETARLMHLHKNSLGYRIRRIETIIGRDLHDPREVTELQLAMAVLSRGRTG
jgi:sugar diacid utilization regulator